MGGILFKIRTDFGFSIEVLEIETFLIYFHMGFVHIIKAVFLLSVCRVSNGITNRFKLYK